MPETTEETTNEAAELPSVTITPTVGRVVHYYKNSGAKPLIGLIASVESNTKVNLARKLIATFTTASIELTP